MKKFTALLLALVLTFSLSAVAFAAETSGITVKYDLGVNGSNDIQARTGDVITVAYRISASGSAPVMVSQNKIYYDTDFFELVENSNKPSAGFTDFTTVHRQNLKGEWRVFFGTTATRWAVGAGLIQGRGASTLAPRGQATRAEVAAILMHFCQKIGA